MAAQEQNAGADPFAQVSGKVAPDTTAQDTSAAPPVDTVGMQPMADTAAACRRRTSVLWQPETDRRFAPRRPGHHHAHHTGVGHRHPRAAVFANGIEIPVSAGRFRSDLPIPDEQQQYQVEIIAQGGGNEISQLRTVTYQVTQEKLSLEITAPADGENIRQRSIRIVGKASMDASVTVNGSITSLYWLGR